MVKAGDLLFRVDPEPYGLQISEANAAIAVAQANVTAMSNSSDLSGAAIAAAREDIGFAQARLERQRALWDRGFTTKADYEAAQHAVAQAREELRMAEATQREAQAKLAHGAAAPGENPQIAAAEARRAEAQLALRRTEIRAPISGPRGAVGPAQLGQQAVTSLPMLTLVADKELVRRGQLQGDRSRPDARRPARRDSLRRLSRHRAQGPRVLDRRGHRVRVLGAAGAERHRQLGQGHPARAGADRDRREEPARADRGLSTHVTVLIDGRGR
jgi:membrane fusion protein (multidrug efflux system)